MLLSIVKGSYSNAPSTLLSTWQKCRLLQITLIKIQQLIFKKEADLSSRLIAQEPLPKTFDGAFTGCRITLAALNFELDKLVEPKKSMKPMDFGFQAKAPLVWKENIMEQLLDQTSEHISSLEFLIYILAQAVSLSEQDTARIWGTVDRAKLIRSEQGVTDDQSSIHLARQSVASYGVVPSQSPTYQRAQVAAADELLAGKMKFVGEKYALEEQLESLRLEVASKNEKVTQLEHEILVKDKTIGRLEHDILLSDRCLRLKDEKINELIDKITTPTSPGIVGVLFKSCADLFWLMTKELCLSNSIEQKEKSVVRDTYERFYLWGEGFEAEQGGLDKILVSSTNLKDQILSLLLRIAKILDTGDPPNRN